MEVAAEDGDDAESAEEAGGGEGAGDALGAVGGGQSEAGGFRYTSMELKTVLSFCQSTKSGYETSQRGHKGIFPNTPTSRVGSR